MEYQLYIDDDDGDGGEAGDDGDDGDLVVMPVQVPVRCVIFI